MPSQVNLFFYFQEKWEASLDAIIFHEGRVPTALGFRYIFQPQQEVHTRLKPALSFPGTWILSPNKARFTLH